MKPLTEEMKRAILCLTRYEPTAWPTTIEFRRETYVGWQTIVSLVKRGLVEFVLPKPQGNPKDDRIARDVFTLVQLTAAGEKTALELKLEAKKGRSHGG